jgi:hypothetical protein
MSDDSNFDCENNINDAARAYCDNLIPSVSRERYEKVFREFEAWCNRKKVKQITEITKSGRIHWSLLSV